MEKLVVSVLLLHSYHQSIFYKNMGTSRFFESILYFFDSSFRIGFNQRDRDAYVEKIARTLPSSSTVLDVGAGRGIYRHFFDHCIYKTHDFKKYHPIDRLHNPYETWEYTDIDYKSDITHIPVEDKSFDFILCTEVLEHVPDPIAAIREMARIVKSGGRILITAPLGSGLHQKPYHFFGGFTPYFYQKYLSENKCIIKEIVPNGGFLKHFVQESGRVSDWLIMSHTYRRYDPRRLAIRFLFHFLIPLLLYKKDEKYFLEDFTVEYFVLAQKNIKFANDR